MIVLTAILKAKKGKENELEDALRAMIPKVKEEEGVVEYILHRSLDTSGTFFFFEKYTDQAAIDYHMETSYLKDLVSRFDELLCEAPQLERYEELASIKE